jgi:hypothetical protein
MTEAQKCKPVTAKVRNRTIDLIAVDCLQPMNVTA